LRREVLLKRALKRGYGSRTRSVYLFQKSRNPEEKCSLYARLFCCFVTWSTPLLWRRILTFCRLTIAARLQIQILSIQWRCLTLRAKWTHHVRDVLRLCIYLYVNNFKKVFE
jgi:hypothetical protein